MGTKFMSSKSSEMKMKDFLKKILSAPLSVKVAACIVSFVFVTALIIGLMIDPVIVICLVSIISVALSIVRLIVFYTYGE